MSMWKRVGIAVGLTPVVAHAQTNNPFSTLYPLILSMFDLFSLRWVPANMQGYAAKAIIFIAFAVLIHYGLTKANFPNKVAVTIAISIAALGIIFFPDNLEMAGGGNFGLIFGLIVLGLPIAAIIYMLLKIVHNKVQTPAFKHLAYGGICLVGYSMLANSMVFMGYSPHTSDQAVLSGIAQGLAFLGLVGLLYIVTGLFQLFSRDTWQYEGAGDPDLFSKDKKRAFQKESSEERRKRKAERAFHDTMYSEEKRRSGLAKNLNAEINEVVVSLEKYLHNPSDRGKAFDKVTKIYGKFKQKYSSLIKELREENRNFNEYLRLERTKSGLSQEQRDYVAEKERELMMESRILQSLSENIRVFFRAVDEALRADRSNGAELNRNIQVIRNEVVKLRELFSELQEIESKQEQLEHLQRRADQVGGGADVS